MFEAIKVLVPPKEGDIEGQTRWRWVVFMSIVGLGSGLMLHVALACGYLPAVSPGFASTSDTKAIQRRVDLIAILSIEHEIRWKTGELCKTTDYRQREDLNAEVSRLQRDYRDILGVWYNVPSCDKL